MQAFNFHKSFFKNILLYMNGGLSKISSVHTYVLKGFIHVVSTVGLMSLEQLTDLNAKGPK